MTTPLHLLSGGAAQGLVAQLRDQFQTQQGCAIDGTFGAVGMMKDRLLGGAPCDVVILTQALIAGLVGDGHAVAGSARDLGVVKTGVAVQAGDAAPAVDTPETLKAALLAAREIYFPDPIKATAGIHFMRVLNELGIADTVAPRLRPFPNGATAMGAMAKAQGPGLIGCTQVTEILYTPGVQLIAELPKQFELATVYTAAVSTRAAHPAAATALVALLASPEAAALRRAGSFEPLAT